MENRDSVYEDPTWEALKFVNEELSISNQFMYLLTSFSFGKY